MDIEQLKQICIATVCIALGLSFAYKCILAMFFGRTVYWTGFLPLGIFSPFVIHFPPGKNSLIKTTQAWFIHITLGPAFFLCSLALLQQGADQLGLNGTEMINNVLTFGRGGPSAITYSKESGYRFPIVGRMQKAIIDLLTQPMMKDQKGLDGKPVSTQLQNNPKLDGEQSDKDKK